MPRIRTIKPEFWQDEKLAALDPLTRLVFLGLISQADDAGRLVDNVKSLDGLLFPMTDDTCADALDILARLSRISRYVSASGQRLIQVTKWIDHQKVDHPNKHVLPAPSSEVVTPPPDTQSSRESRESGARSSRDSLATTKDLGPVPTTSTVLRSADADAAEPDDATYRAAPFIDAWREIRQGIPNGGLIGRTCKPVAAELGMAEALHRWNRFLAERRHSPAAYFAQEHGQYAGLALVNGKPPPDSEPEPNWIEPPTDPDEIARLKADGFR